MQRTLVPKMRSQMLLNTLKISALDSTSSVWSVTFARKVTSLSIFVDNNNEAFPDTLSQLAVYTAPWDFTNKPVREIISFPVSRGRD